MPIPLPVILLGGAAIAVAASSPSTGEKTLGRGAKVGSTLGKMTAHPSAPAPFRPEDAIKMGRLVVSMIPILSDESAEAFDKGTNGVSSRDFFRLIAANQKNIEAANFAVKQEAVAAIVYQVVIPAFTRLGLWYWVSEPRDPSANMSAYVFSGNSYDSITGKWLPDSALPPLTNEVRQKLIGTIALWLSAVLIVPGALLVPSSADPAIEGSSLPDYRYNWQGSPASGVIAATGLDASGKPWELRRSTIMLPTTLATQRRALLDPQVLMQRELLKLSTEWCQQGQICPDDLASENARIITSLMGEYPLSSDGKSIAEGNIKLASELARVLFTSQTLVVTGNKDPAKSFKVFFIAAQIVFAAVATVVSFGTAAGAVAAQIAVLAGQLAFAMGASISVAGIVIGATYLAVGAAIAAAMGAAVLNAIAQIPVVGKFLSKMLGYDDTETVIRVKQAVSVLKLPTSSFGKMKDLL